MSKFLNLIKKSFVNNFYQNLNLLTIVFKFSLYRFHIYISLARTPEIGQGVGRILSCGARKPEQT